MNEEKIYKGVVTSLLSWGKNHPLLISAALIGYFSLLGLIHIESRLPIGVAIHNGWLDFEDFISIGIALSRAWWILFISIVTIILIALIEKISLNSLNPNYPKILRLNSSDEIKKVSLIIAAIGIFSSVIIWTSRTNYPWLYSNVVTRTGIIHGNSPILESLDKTKFSRNKIELGHLITLKNWVVFTYTKNSNSEKSDLGNLNKEGYLAIPIGSIDSIYFENRVDNYRKSITKKSS